MYNTGNPVPSNALEDMADNAQVFDALVTQTSGTVTDRLGNVRRSYQQVITDMGFNPVSGSFQDGATVTEYNQCLIDETTGTFYSWGGALPKVVSVGSTPATAGGIGPLLWIDRTDLLVREDLTRNGTSIDDLSRLNTTSGASKVKTATGATVEARLTADESSISALLTMTSAQHQLTGPSIAKQLADGWSPVFACYGDSTMWGATVGNLTTQSPNNPPAMLAAALNLLYGGIYTVNNRGISGTTLYDMLRGTDGSGSTFEAKIITGGVDAAANVIICNHGINDSQLNKHIDQYSDDLITFIKLCRTNGKIPVLATPNPNPQIAIISETKSKRLFNYVKMMRAVAKAFSVDLVDQYEFLCATACMVPMTTLIPDGAHPSNDVYKQNGFNLAIPFICAKTIGNDFDTASTDGVTYCDNMTASRLVQIGGRGGVNISGRREATLTGINYPVILEKPRQVVSLIGLQWSSAAKCVLQKNNNNNSGVHYAQRQFGLTSLLDWDSELKYYDAFFAGLNVIQLGFNLSDVGLGSSLTFGGVYLPPRYIACSNGANAVLQHNNRICTYDEVLTSPVFFDNTADFELVDTGGNTVLKITYTSGAVTTSLYKDGVAVQTGTLVASGLPKGLYPVSVYTTQTSVSVTFSGVAFNFTVTSPLPNLRVKTKMCNYTIAPGAGVVNGW